jgi:hypothetical protein
MTLNDIEIIYSEADNGERPIIKIIKGDHAGIKYRYGAVWITGEEGSEVLNFEYHLVEGEPYDKENFKDVLAKILVALIEDVASKGDLLFKGGT